MTDTPNAGPSGADQGGQSQHGQPPGQPPGQPGWGPPPGDPGWGQPPQGGWGQQPGGGWPQQGGAPGWGQQPGYGPPPAGWGPGYPVAAPRNSDKAIGAIICAAGSWIVCPIVLAIVGLVLANQASREIAASNGWVGGAGMVTAARVIAWLNIGLGLLFFFGFFIAFLGSLGSV